MKTNKQKNLYWLIGLLIVVAFSAVMAYQVRSDFGKVEVTYAKIPVPDGHVITARLYRPKYATEQNKLPGVVTIHGGNNDKDTQAPASIELSRRGFVVLAMDMDGHGDNTAGLDMAVYGSGGLLGGDYAFDYLKNLPFVDETRVGATGHSMGGSESLKIAIARPEHKAVAPQDSCSAIDLSKMNNYICFLAGWEYSSSSNIDRKDNYYIDPVFYEGYGFTEPIEYDRLYGSFEDNTAFMISITRTTHPGQPPSHQMITKLLDWMRYALKDGKVDENWIQSSRHIYTYNDVFMGLALLAALGSLVPLTNLLLTIPFFTPVATPLPKGHVAKPKEWWKMALLNAFIAGITYPFLTQFGMWGPLAMKFLQAFPFLKLIIPNGFLTWYLGNALIFAILFFSWYGKKSKENKVTMYDMGVSYEQKKTKFDWGILGKTLLLGVLLVSWLYILVSISQSTLGVEFRVEWGTLKKFATIGRFKYFLIALIPTLIFMLLNMGLFFFGQARQKEYETDKKTQVIWWLKNCVASLPFLALILAFQYIPSMIFNKTLGWNLIGFTEWIKPIGGAEWMYTLSLFYVIPLFIVLIYLLTWFFRRTGKIYLGSLTIALIVAWILSVGHATLK